MKQYFRFQMDFDSRWLSWSLGCMGLSLFARMVFYFGYVNLADCGFAQMLFGALLPACVAVGYIFLLKIKELNAPGIYGILAAAMCLCFLVGSAISGNVLRVILGIVWYLLCGGVILAFSGGFLPGKTPVLAAFGIAIVGKILFFTPVGITGWVRDGADLFALVAFLLLPYGMKAGRGKISETP